LLASSTLANCPGKSTLGNVVKVYQLFFPNLDNAAYMPWNHLEAKNNTRLPTNNQSVLYSRSYKPIINQRDQTTSNYTKDIALTRM
jgi:hypothetical protein